jgi:hypothetical protein
MQVPFSGRLPVKTQPGVGTKLILRLTSRDKRHDASQVKTLQSRRVGGILDDGSVVENVVSGRSCFAMPAAVVPVRLWTKTQVNTYRLTRSHRLLQQHAFAAMCPNLSRPRRLDMLAAVCNSVLQQHHDFSTHLPGTTSAGPLTCCRVSA